MANIAAEIYAEIILVVTVSRLAIRSVSPLRSHCRYNVKLDEQQQHHALPKDGVLYCFHFQQIVLKFGCGR